MEEPLASGNESVGLPPGTPTLPSELKRAGYETALVGKWHMGRLPNYGPLQSGYDHFWGFRGGGIDYFTHEGTGREADLWDGDSSVESAGYLTDLLADRAVAMLQGFAERRTPFLLSLHFNAPHWPWEGPDDEVIARQLQADDRPIQHFDGGSLRTYAQIVTRLDYQVGRVLSELRRLRLERDTIVVFTSDNGGERFSYLWPFSGRKGELLEGGVRVPAIVRWPSAIRRPSVSQDPIATMDWMPTLLAAANVESDPAAPSDGVSILPALAGERLGERDLFWRFRGMRQEACRRGDWKYLKINGNTFLFNLRDDPMERANLKAARPEMFEALAQAYAQWDATMLATSPRHRTFVLSGDRYADRNSGAED